MIEQMMAQLATNLTPQELQRIDAAITPEIGALLIKGVPELAPIVEPLMRGGAPVAPGQQPMPMPTPPAAAPQQQGPGMAAMPQSPAGAPSSGGRPRFLSPEGPKSGLRNIGFGQ